jgi:DNA-binding transcriptional regulator YdaS (Cro superfamily)
MKNAIDTGAITAGEVIDLLGGTMAVAEILSIKPPSVSEWKLRNSIPNDKLIRLAVTIESKTEFRINRQTLFPADWQRIWPEIGAMRQPETVSPNPLPLG